MREVVIEDFGVDRRIIVEWQDLILPKEAKE